MPIRRHGQGRSASTLGFDRAAERDGLDALVLVQPGAGDGRSRFNRRRCGHVARAAGHHLEHAPAVVQPQLQPAAADVEHVAAAQPGRARDAGAVVQHVRVRARGLHEELAVVLREPGLNAAGPGQDHLGPVAAERERKLRCADDTLAQRLAQDQVDAQMGSSQRITSVGAALPGSSVSSRRTSR